MIKKINIKNFKGWKDTGEIKMAPITVFFGTNSSGKSGIGHLLLLLQQTVNNPDRKTIIYSGDRSSPIYFNSLLDIVHCHDINKRIQFDYCWNLPEINNIKDRLTKKLFEYNEINFKASIGLSSRKTTELDFFEYLLKKDNENILSIYMKKRSTSSISYTIGSTEYNLVKNNNNQIGFPDRFYGFPESIITIFQNANFSQDLIYHHENLYRNIFYLGPLRNNPERTYTRTSNEFDSVGYTGRNAISILLASHELIYNIGVNNRFMNLKEIITEKLNDMGLLISLQINCISDERQIYEIKVQTKGSECLVDLTDVGFGVSQVLPVLIQLFYAPKNSILIMEQPEMHLHPKAQSLLADVMIDAINAKENGKERNVQLIIETHSEHFLRRLQRRIAEDKISSNQIAAYFANVNENPTRLDALDIDDYGNIKNWPNDFFGDEMGEAVAQSIAALKKRSTENENAQIRN